MMTRSHWPGAGVPRQPNHDGDDCGCVASGDSLRCGCGCLLARFLPSGELELKCRRCKRTVAVPIERTVEEESP